MRLPRVPSVGVDHELALLRGDRLFCVSSVAWSQLWAWGVWRAGAQVPLSIGWEARPQGFFEKGGGA